MRQHLIRVGHGIHAFVSPALVIYLLALPGCSHPVTIRIYPPGADVRLDEHACVSPCRIALSRVPRELHYEIEKEPLYKPSVGTIEARVAPGRVVGAIFTLGIVAMAKGIYYLPSAHAQLDPRHDPADRLSLIERRGSGHIEGQAFTETRGGEVRHAAGDTITLRPDTEYVRDALKYLNDLPTSVPADGWITSDPDLAFLAEYKRQTIGDAEGRFVFDDVAPGAYIITATIRWSAATGGVDLSPQWVGTIGFADVVGGKTTVALVTDWSGQIYGDGYNAAVPPITKEEEALGQRQLPASRDAR